MTKDSPNPHTLENLAKKLGVKAVFAKMPNGTKKYWEWCLVQYNARTVKIFLGTEKKAAALAFMLYHKEQQLLLTSASNFQKNQSV